MGVNLQDVRRAKSLLCNSVTRIVWQRKLVGTKWRNVEKGDAFVFLRNMSHLWKSILCTPTSMLNRRAGVLSKDKIASQRGCSGGSAAVIMVRRTLLDGKVVRWQVCLLGKEWRLWNYVPSALEVVGLNVCLLAECWWPCCATDVLQRNVCLGSCPVHSLRSDESPSRTGLARLTVLKRKFYQ